MTAAPEPSTGRRPGVAADRRGRTPGGHEAAAAPGVPRGPIGVAPKSRVAEPAGPGAARPAGAGAEETPKKSKKKLVAVAVAVVVLAGGYMVKGRSHKVVYKAGQPVPPGQVTSIGTLTVNTVDGHIVQAGIDLQLTKPAQTKKITADQPQLKNAAIADLGDQTYPGLLAPAGRTALLQQLLTSFQQVLGPVDGAAQQVSAVYFTSFILQ
ncbi:MAG: flagellar basal body-associated FliL family protein [Acidimicrobiales bacterium]